MPKPKITFEWSGLRQGDVAGPEMYVYINGKKIGSVRNEKTWGKALKIIYTAGYKDGNEAMKELLQILEPDFRDKEEN